MSNNENGQALFEFVLYVPVLIMMYFMATSIGNSINGSINQQKVTRSYYFGRIKNNSYVPKPEWGYPEGYPPGWSTFGMSVIGYKTNVFPADAPVAPQAACYKTPLSNIPIDNTLELGAKAVSEPKDFTDPGCDSSYTETRTPNIRVYTVFGICGATYSRDRGYLYVNTQASTPAACTIF